jgi:arylsulfatase A-like enzyme
MPTKVNPVLRAAFVLFATVYLATTPSPVLGGETKYSPSASRPNIVFILADDLGYGDLGCYGQTKITTPNIDRMARNGMRFTDHYAGATVCGPSRCVLMTGLHTGHCRLRGNGTSAENALRPEDVTVAEVLKQAGYATGQVGKWSLGKEGTTGVPTQQGFDSFFGYLDQTHAHLYYPTFLIRNERRVELRNAVPNQGPYGEGIARKKIDYSPALMLDESLAYIDEHRDEPFFLYLPFTLPHANNEAALETGDGTEVPDLGIYEHQDWTEPNKGQAAMISYLDSMVGQIVARLEKHQLLENTLIFFTSDNGPHAESGNDVAFFDANGPTTGIKRSLHDGGLRVPLIVQWSGHIKPNTMSSHVCGAVDFMATAAELSEAKLQTATDGISFLPTLLGNTSAQKPHEYLYWEFYEQGSKQALRMGKWKAIRRPMKIGPIELYDLSQDIAESRDVAAEHSAEVELAARLLAKAHTPSPRWNPSGERRTAAAERSERMGESEDWLSPWYAMIVASGIFLPVLRRRRSAKSKQRQE